MKNLLIGTALIVSSAMGVTACSSVNAATDTKPNAKAPVVQKGEARHHDRVGRGNPNKKPFAELNLTADQEAKIKAIMQKNHDGRNQNFEAMKNERQAMQSQVQSLANSPTLNNAELNRLASLEAEKTRQRFINRVQSEREIAQVLTPEQRQKLAAMKADRQNKRADHFQNRAKKSGKDHPRFAPKPTPQY